MDFITPAEARQIIIDLALPTIVLDIFDEKPLPYDLDIQFSYPYQIFELSPSEQARFGVGRVTPIWTCDGDCSAVAYRFEHEHAGFIRFDFETACERDPGRMNWQQVLVKEFQFLWESDLPDDRIREIAALFQFEHADRLMRELAQADADIDRWYRQFLESVSSE